jgi:anti-sigma regulatory factor (Ser/Thr protein kinase)
LATTEEALLELAPELTSPKKARVFISAAFRQWGCDQVEDRAELLVSELVTNAIEHMRSYALLSARRDDGRVEVRVEDDGDSLPTLSEPAPEHERGRGLMLVNLLADHWGVELLPDGRKVVYFAFDC